MPDKQYLRVLIVLPFYGGSLPIGQFCTMALKDLGHIAEEFDATQFSDAFFSIKKLNITDDKLRLLEATYLQFIGQAIIAKVEKFKPDFVLTMAQAPATQQVLTYLKQKKIPSVMWFVEDYKIFTYWQVLAPLYDVFAVIQGDIFKRKLVSIGQNNSIYLPLAALPKTHCKLKLSPSDMKKFGSDLSFMGAGYPNRRAAFRQLNHKNLKIWGIGWEGDNILKNNIQLDGQRIPTADVVKIYNATKININLHSSVQDKELVPEGDFINPRTFELAAMGAFQLVDKRQCMPDLFATDDLATFSNMDELKEKIDYFLKNPKEMDKFKLNAQKKVLSEHTYQHRMQTLIDFMQKTIPNWPKTKTLTNLPEHLPDELKIKLNGLLQKLNLMANASFEEVIDKIKQEHGALTEVETALLFMHELRKQYSPKK